MSIFMLETESASSGASQINSVGTQVSSLGSTVGGYDISCEDGFDFATARGVLANNIEACATKMQNTSKIIESVVSSHTELQNSLKFDSPSESDALEDGDKDNDNDKEAGDNVYDEYAGTYGPSSGYDSGTVAAPSVAAATVPALSDEDLGEATEDVELVNEDELGLGEEDLETDEEFTPGVIDTKLTSSGYAYLEDDYIDDNTKAFISDPKYSYDENGYARYGDYYVISCDTSFGKVGDIVQFKQKDGSVVDCIIGVNTTSDKFKGAINFIVKKDPTQVKALDFTRTLVSNNEVVTNMGNVNSMDASKIELPTDSTTVSSANLETTVPDVTVPDLTSTASGDNSANDESTNTIAL